MQTLTRTGCWALREAHTLSLVLSFLPRRKTKARAPPPPGKPALPSMPSEQKPPRDAAIGCHQNLIHQQEALRDSTLDVTVVLPSGLEKQSVVSGR